MNLFTKIMITNDGALKRVHTEVSDITSSDVFEFKKIYISFFKDLATCKKDSRA